MKKLAIISTHPIQYNAPLFRLLAERNKIGIKVFYTWSQSQETEIYDPGFGIRRKWDIPLLNGYDHVFIPNISKNPGSHHFWGIQNPELIHSIDEYQPDAVMVYGWSFASHLKAMRHYKSRVPVYFRGDSTLLDETKHFSINKALRRIFLKWVYGNIDHAFYTGEYNKQYFLAHGLGDRQLSFVPHAIDNSRFSNEVPVINYREQLGIPQDAVCILFAGKLEEKKDPLLLLNSFIGINNPGVWLVIVGNGVLENELKAAAKGNARIAFLPFRNQMEMPSVYRMADLFVLPSKGPGETWGLAVNEAMASSVAVLVSDKCGCSFDLVKPGINGEIFKAGDPASIKQKLQQLITDKALLKRYGRNGRQLIGSWAFENCATIIEHELSN
jgi:glycosyltransferase involved in cell wall biosynthesis